MFDRQHTRHVKNTISSYDVHTTFRVIDGNLGVAAPNGLCQEQRDLIRFHKQALIEIFTTPPPPATCIRGHAVTWQLSEHGEWLCSCYFEMAATPIEKQQPAQPPETLDLSEYWEQGRSLAHLNKQRRVSVEPTISIRQDLPTLLLDDASQEPA